MSVFHNNALIGASGNQTYNLSRSLRFRASASAFLNRTPASAGNRKTWTWSAWVKRGSLGTGQWLFAGGPISTDYTLIRFGSGGNNNDNLEYVRVVNSAIDAQKISSAVYRDPSAWYHIVVTEDAANAVARVYVNGLEITYSTNDNPSNVDGAINNNVIHNIGRYTGSNIQLFDGYMTEVNFIDGQALTPSSFGMNDPNTGVWEPIRYAGTYGTNGFYLPFTDTSSTTNLVADRSGRGNNWTPNNISLTAGVTYDSMTDVPTLTSATAANYAVFNPLIVGNVLSPTNGNLQASFVGVNGYYSTVATIPITSGKWYWEATITSRDAGAGQWIQLGIVSSTTTYTNNPIGYSGNMSNAYAYYNDGSKAGNGSFGSYGATFTTNDVIGVAFDDDAGTITFYKNGVSQGQAYSGISTTTEWLPIFQVYGSTGTANAAAINFGQRPFAYTPPSGFVALNTFNLPTPTIGATASTVANKYFDATLAIGNNSTQVITNAGSFQPDFVWMKIRSGAENHIVYDSVRGAQNYLVPNLTIAEASSSQGLTSFNSNGFTLGNINPNYAGSPSFVAWQWRASNTTAVTNTAGSITSTVSANTTAGFSIVTYTGTANASDTVGHGLGVAPRMVIVKGRSVSFNWMTYHASAGATRHGYLNLTNAFEDPAGVSVWNDTAPSSTVFTINNNANVNGSGATFVAYCFAEVAGYSRFGSYTGNGSTDGPFVFCGFRPKFVIYKRTDSTGNWFIDDSTRLGYNVITSDLLADAANAEASYNGGLDILSNGFKLRATANGNANGGTYIYMAFAEHPFKYSLAR